MRFSIVVLATMISAVLAVPAPAPSLEEGNALAERANLQKRYTCFVNDPDCNVKCRGGSGFLNCAKSKCIPIKGTAFGNCQCNCCYSC